MKIYEELNRSSRELVRTLAKTCIKDKSLLRQLVQVSLSEEEPYNWRAAWTLSHLADIDVEALAPHLNKLIAEIPNSTHHTQIGCFAGMLSRIDFNMESSGNLFDWCIHLISTPQKRMSNKCYAIKIMRKFVAFEPALGEETCNVLELCMPTFESPYLKKLAKETVKMYHTPK